MCVLVLFRASVCAFRVSELLVVRLSFVAKLFCLRCVSCEIPRFSCRVLNSSFSFEFVVEIFVSSFEFKFLEFSYRFSNSSFRVEFRIRLFRFVALFDFSNFNFRFEFVVEIFDGLLYSTSRISIRICRRTLIRKFRCSIRLLEIDRQSRLLEFRLSIRLLDSSPLNLMIRNCRRISNSSFSSS